MQIVSNITLDFGRDTLPITVFAKQNDQNSRFIKITPLNCGQTYTLDSGITARLQLAKPDGHTVINDATIENNAITGELTAQVLSAAGMAVAEIGLYKNNALLSSQVFYIDIKKSAYNIDAVESTDEYNSLVAAFDNATAATEAAERVNISATQTPTGADITVTNREGVETTVHVDTLLAVHTWEDVRNAIRLGRGEALFPAGYEFTTHDSDTDRDIIWAVRAHDHHTAANSRLTHTMTLETKYVYSLSSGSYQTLQFDQQEALYYAEEGLAAGTYNFTVANQAWFAGDNGKVFQFTLAQPVPAGGQIYAAMTYNQTFAGKNITTYASPSSAAAIETVTITEGSAGTSLGTTDGSGNMNHLHRIAFGSNNYAQSAARQWLNSGAAAGSVWVPTNKFDRPASWATSYTGFMHGLPADFLAVVQPAVIPCRTNSAYECNSLDGTEFTTNQLYNLEDKFFLLSRPEIYGSWDSSSYKDGEQLDYYTGLTNTELIKYDAASSAHYCWLRSPHSSHASIERHVDIDGSLYGSNARGAYGVAPACIIA